MRPQLAYATAPDPGHPGVRSSLIASPSAALQASPAARYQPGTPRGDLLQVPPAGHHAGPFRPDTADPAGRTTAIATADTAPIPVILPSSSQVAPYVAPARVPAPAPAKLDQIKDLYLTAEAIGEDALVKHFEEVSSRQRALIREYFEQSGFGPNGAPKIFDESRAQSEAQLPG